MERITNITESAFHSSLSVFRLGRKGHVGDCRRGEINKFLFRLRVGSSPLITVHFRTDLCPIQLPSLSFSSVSRQLVRTSFSLSQFLTYDKKVLYFCKIFKYSCIQLGQEGFPLLTDKDFYAKDINSFLFTFLYLLF